MENYQGYQFIFNKRLGISIPHFTKDWDEYTLEEQVDIIICWESERAKIPEQIKKIEREIMVKQDSMFDMDFEEYCAVHDDIVDLSSAINDLNIWYRTEGEITHK